MLRPYLCFYHTNYFIVFQLLAAIVPKNPAPADVGRICEWLEAQNTKSKAFHMMPILTRSTKEAVRTNKQTMHTNNALALTAQGKKKKKKGGGGAW